MCGSHVFFVCVVFFFFFYYLIWSASSKLSSGLSLICWSLDEWKRRKESCSCCALRDGALFLILFILMLMILNCFAVMTHKEREAPTEATHKYVITWSLFWFWPHIINSFKLDKTTSCLMFMQDILGFRSGCAISVAAVKLHSHRQCASKME